MKKDKGQNTCFYVNTSSEIYTIKCNSDLDWDLWIKSLIHSTNLAKESFIIKDINKKIELNQTFLFEISSKNSICDTNFVFADRRQLDRAFSIFEKYPESFLPKVNNAAEVVPLLKSLTVNFLEAKRLKSDPSALQTFQNKVTACIAILHNPMMEDLHSQGFVASTLADEQLPGEEDHTGVQHTFEENFDRLAKIIDDLFYNLQRLSVSNNIFLEEYYSRLENANLKQCEGIIV
jgi:hypothetical protein